MADPEMKQAGQKKPPWRIAGMLLGLLLVGMLVWRVIAVTRTPARKPSPPPVVSVAPVQQRDMTIYLSALGTVTPNNTVTVHSRVDGQLMRLGFVEGQLVKAGQVLAVLDPRPFQVALAQAEGQLAKDQALLKNARLDLGRYRTLLTQDSISTQTVATQASLVAQYQGAVASDRAAVESARLQLDYSQVTAPFAGRVGLKQVDLGNIVHAADTNGIVVITQMQPTNVLFSIPETQLSEVLPSVRANNKLRVDIWNRDNQHKIASGKLLTIDNQVDTTTGMVKLKAVFTNHDNQLFPNQFVNVRLAAAVRKNAIVIPQTALQRGQPGAFVYLLQPDNTVKLQVIDPGQSEGELLIVNNGLTVGERVVTDGVDSLRDGGKVTVAGSKQAAGSGDWTKRHKASN